MASQIAAPPGGDSAMKLPQITEGRNLVSPVQASQIPSLKEQVSVWALNVRQRLTDGLSSEEGPDETDVMDLVQEVNILFIQALQKDNRHAWLFLHEAMSLLEPYKNLLAGKPEILHYLSRVVHHLEVHQERLFDYQVTEALNRIFTHDMKTLKDTGTKPAVNYCTPVPPPSVASLKGASKPMVSARHQKYFGGRNPFLLEYPEDQESYLRPKPMTFGDLRASLPDVAMEMATREAIWSACLGSTARALNIDIPEEPAEEGAPSTHRSSGGSRMSVHSEKVEEEMSQCSEEAEDLPQTPMNGREAVEFFSKCYHTGKIKFLYFNKAPNRHYRPYELVAVPKNKVNSEHFVFSTFGVLHVLPDQPAENQSLAAWQKEAVLYKATSAIPFFKNFLVRKMFTRWRENIHFADFAHIRHDVTHSLLHLVPAFGASLLQVLRLCQELTKLNFLPDNTEKCYELGEFENSINYMSMQADRVLERFFRYNKIIVDTTSEECFRKLRHCEEQIRRKPNSKDSLHLQRVKKKQRESNLRKGKKETGRLGNFVKLVDQILLSHLVQVARASVVKFVHDNMGLGPDAPRDALFKAALVFGPQDTLDIFPTKDKILRSLARTFGGIPTMLCRAAIPLDGSMQFDVPPPASVVSESGSTSPKTSSRHTSIVSMLRDAKKARLTMPGPHQQLLQGRGSHQGQFHSTTTLASDRTLTKASEALSERDEERSRMTPDSAVMLDGMLTSPDLQRAATPTKSEDELGQATPDLVIPAETDRELQVSGRGFMGQYKPLAQGNLEAKLLNDEAYQEAIRLQGKLMKEAMEEVEEYCVRNAWLNEIQLFCKGWTDQSVYDWKGAAAFTIEQKMNEIRGWIEKVRIFDKNYITDNGIFFLDCSGIQDNLVPKLDAIFNELCTYVAGESHRLARQFCDDMKIILKNMSTKETSIGAFAVYAKNVTKYKKNTPHYQQRLEYIKSLFEVIRMSYRQLTPEEEKLEESVMGSWDSFLINIQEAMEYVNTQKPLIARNLEDTFQRLEEEAARLCEEATTGKFLDPKQNPTAVLIDMRRLREKFYEIQKQMQEASKWKEAITGEPYDLCCLNQMATRMDIRQELWKYVEVSSHAIQEWRKTLFRKMNVRRALDKLMEWLSAAGQMNQHLPAGDEVLANWYRQLQDFKQDLPLLHKMANDALKTRHWKAIFVSMGEPFDPEHQFTVDELLAYNLGTHSAAINSVYAAAVAEFAIEQKLVQIRRLWEDREFKLAKHIPDSVYKKDDKGRWPRSTSTPGRRMKRFEKFRYDKAMANTPRTLEVKHENMYILIETEELKYLLEDSMVTLHSMLSSPYLADHLEEAKFWAGSLQEIDEIIDQWVTCQTKWLYLLKVFEDCENFRSMGQLGLKFEALSNKFTDFMMNVVSDPKVTAMLTKPRGEKGYRVLQGERARVLLTELVAEEEEMLKHLDGLLDQSRCQFPRLYFLSDAEMVELLAVSRNPKALLPTVKKCFHGIQNLTYTLPPEVASLSSTLDYQLNAHKLEVTTLHGALGEELVLNTKLEAHPVATRWLCMLEQCMKTTLHTIMEACVLARLEDSGSRQPLQLLEELAQFDDAQGQEKEELTRDIQHRFTHWLLRFPTQCVIAAEAVMWERSAFRALERQDRDELKLQRANLHSREEQYIKVLRDNLLKSDNLDMRRRLHCLLGCLINQSLYHRDVTDNLLRNQNLSDGAYDWLKLLKYHMEIRTILRAKTESSEKDTDPDVSRPSTAGLPERNPDFRESLDSIPQLHRSVTTVSTGYQFGRCLVTQMGATFGYDCEYLGPTPRLVFTPLTERAYLTLTMALRSFQCGTLIGPAGTGKTETVKDLAKGLGRHLVVVNCSEDLVLPRMNLFLNGLIQSGCWALFDETDRMTVGLMSVFAQQLEYLRNALRVLDATSDNQYGIRGQPRFDKKTATKSGDRRIRRNSLTTLHSLPPAENLTLERQTTVPHGFNEEGLNTYFGDTWIKERERRHSIEKEIQIKESELYRSNRPPPLFYEHVTLHRKRPKPDYKDLIPQFIPYKPLHIGNVLFNGKLVKANANHGCFMTLNTENTAVQDIPENMRLLMRQCALVVPDLTMILEARLYYQGFLTHAVLAKRLTGFHRLINTQLPKNPQYDFSLRSMMIVVHVATVRLHDQLQRRTDGQSEDDQETPNMYARQSMEEDLIIQAVNAVLVPKMASNEDAMKLKNLLRDMFPTSSRPKSGLQRYDPDLIQAIHDQLRQNNLEVNELQIHKILQLYSAMEQSQSILLTGPSGSGKSVAYQMLAKALTLLHEQEVIPDDEEEFALPRSMVFQSKQKLKLLRGAEIRQDSQNSPRRWQKIASSFSNLTTAANLYLEGLDDKDPIIYPKIDVDVLVPNALNPQELFGHFIDGIWKKGLLAKLIQEADFEAESAKSVMANWDPKKNKLPQEFPAIIHKWIILDGILHPAWVDGLSSLLDGNKKLSLANGASVVLQDTTSVIFETSDLTTASPSMVTRCAVVHCGNSLLTWKSMFEAWTTAARQKWVISNTGVQILSALMSSLFSNTLTFLASECTPAMLHGVTSSVKTANEVTPGIQEVTSFLDILSALLDQHLLRDEYEKRLKRESTSPAPRESADSPGGALDRNRTSRMSSITRLEDLIPNYMSVIKAMFSFAYIWGFGGHLHESCMPKFNKFARESLLRAAVPVTLPQEGTVFDYCINPKTGEFVNWNERPLEKTRGASTQYVLIPEVDRYNFLMDLLLSHNKPVMLVGAPGVGKTALIENMVQAKHPYSKVTLSRRYTSAMLQDKLTSHLDFLTQQSSGSLTGHPFTKVKGRHLFFLEDFSHAASDPATGCMATSELIRQVLTYKGAYDRDRLVFKSLSRADFLAAATLTSVPGVGAGVACHPLNTRMTRLFTVLHLVTPGGQQLENIYSKSVLSWLEEFPNNTVEHHVEFTKAIIQGTIELYTMVREKLKPTPAHAHYVFSLYDLARVMEGILLLSPRSKVKAKSKKKGESDRRRKISNQEKGAGSQQKLQATSSQGAPEVKESSSAGFSSPPGAPPAMMRVIARLWCHECSRTFADRIIGEEDQQWFESILQATVKKYFCTSPMEWGNDIGLGSHDGSDTQSESQIVRRPTPIPSKDMLLTSSSEATPEDASVVQEGHVGDDEESTPQDEDDRPASRDEQYSQAPPSTPLSPSSAHTGRTTAEHTGHITPEDADVETGESAAVKTSVCAETAEVKPTEPDLTAVGTTEGTVSPDKQSVTGHTSEEGGGLTVEATGGSPYTTDGDTLGSDSDETESDTSSDATESTQSEYSTESSSIHALSRLGYRAAMARQAAEKNSESTASSPSPLGSPTSRQSFSTSESRSRSPLGQGPSSQGVGGRKVMAKVGPKRAVTFKAGLIADREHEAYYGPLMSMDQIKEPGEKLSEVIFSRYILSMYRDATGAHVEKGYTECSIEQLAAALPVCSAMYNHSTGQQLDLVFFREAIIHTTRLARTLALQGGNALLLGASYATGRATLARLAAYIASCKMFEPKVQLDGSCNREIVHKHLKRCSRTAAIHNRQVVLLLHESLGDECLEDVCTFIKEGTCPGLYTTEEIQTIASHLTPGHVKTTRVDKVEQIFNKFLQRVKHNLHVIVSLSYKDGTTKNNYAGLHDKLRRFPALVHHCSSIDVYRQWTHEAYVLIAKQWLTDPTSKVPIPWSEHNKPDQVALVSNAMAYIHSSAMAAVEKLHCHQSVEQKFFTPLTFMELVHLFRILAAYIAKQQRKKMVQYEGGLSKMNEAYGSITQYKREVSDLVPRHHKSLATVKEHVQYVETQREDYIQALDRCKEQEDQIERMISPLEMLRLNAQKEFDKVNPTYFAALEALKSLCHSDIEEIKSYRAPPAAVKLVLDAVCLLFRQPQTWEAGKLLLIQDTFFKDLEFYDKDNIPDDIFNKLGQYCKDPTFNLTRMKQISQAAASLCHWVHAVHKYAQISRTMKPKLQELQDAEEELSQAQAILGSKRVEANRIKNSLEARIKSHKEAVKQAKSIEKQIQAIEKKITKASHLMDKMNTQNAMWKSELRLAKSKIKTCPGDALLTAACVCYHGPLDSFTRNQLLSDWLNRCEMGYFDPAIRFGKQAKPMSLSAKLASLMRPSYSITESTHSLAYTETLAAESHRGDDISSIHETERASSVSSMPMYKPHALIYDTGISFRQHIFDSSDAVNADLESMDASSISSKNLLAVRENYSLQDVLSSFEELSSWKIQGLPTDIHSIHNGLIMRICCHNMRHCWPLLIDPEGQAETWVKTLQGSRHIIRETDVVPELEDRPSVVNQDVPEKEDAETGSTIRSVQAEEKPPGSRGTALTFSDVNEFNEYYADDTTDTESTVHNRASGMMTVHTESSYQALTSVSNSHENFHFNLDVTFTRPDGNLWVIEADDPDLDSRLSTAVVHGMAVLVTHIERKPLDPLFRALLLKQFTVDKEGYRIIRVGDMQFRQHPDFCLYISTATPVFLKGDGLHDLPVQKMCLIDMSSSQEEIVDRLLSEIMSIERPEFEGQRRSIETDLLHHQHELNKEHATIMNKTLGLGVPLLEEKSMLDLLLECQRNIERNKTILEETHYLREHLEEKRVHYVPVATHAAVLYETAQKVAVLSPYYYIPFSAFIKLVSDVIQSRQRGKGSIGAPKARATELIDGITAAASAFMSNMTFEPHADLYALLVTIEKLQRNQKVTNRELNFFINGLDTSEVEDKVTFDNKPDWISVKIWLDIAALETSMLVYRGLRDCLIKQNLQWQEYFKCPVVLIAPVPSEKLQDLTVFQKVLLWRTCAPHRLVEVCQALILFEMGGSMPPVKTYNVREVYSHCDKATPVVLLLPSPYNSTTSPTSTHGYPFINPAHEIIQLAKDMKMDGRVHVVTFGVKSQMSEVKHAMQDCMQAGYWLVLQNAHLAEPWSPEMLQLLKTIMNSNTDPLSEEEVSVARAEDSSSEGSDHMSTQSQTHMTTSHIEHERIHKDFRLWVTTRVDTGGRIPGLLIQHGVKVTCEVTHNVKDSLKRIYANTERIFGYREQSLMAMRKTYEDFNPLVPLSLLHTLLMHHRTCGATTFSCRNHWSHVDLICMTETLRTIMLLCQRHKGVAEICGHVLSSSCLDPVDQQFVQALANKVLLSPHEIKMLPNQPTDVSSLLKALLPWEPHITLDQMVDDLMELTPEMLGLPSNTVLEHQYQQSRNLLSNLQQTCGAPDTGLDGEEILYQRADILLQELEAIFHTLPEIPDEKPNSFYPLEAFYNSEVQTYNLLIEGIKKDIRLLINATRGDVSPTPEIHEKLKKISQQIVPSQWTKYTFIPGVSLMKWANSIAQKIELLHSYMDEKQPAVTMNLAAFNRPDRFLQCYLENHARTAFRDMQNFSYNIQFLPYELKPSSPPDSGFYLEGLLLHNASWDTTKSRLREAQGSQPCPMPVVWLKPVENTAAAADKTQKSYKEYACPVSVCSGKWDHRSQITTISLPTSQSLDTWTERRVYMSVSLR